METKYTKEYFIAKFEALDNWCELSLKDDVGNHCVLGHCGHKHIYETTEESKALIEILKPLNKMGYSGVNHIYFINDGIYGGKKYGKSPKERILNALKAL